MIDWTTIYILGLCLIVMGLVDALTPYRTYFKPNKYCEDDPNKICPYRWYVTKDGGFGCDSKTLVQCCKFKKQLKATNRLMEKMMDKNNE